MFRATYRFLIITAIVSAFALSYQYFDYQVESWRVIASAREVEYSTLQDQYESVTSTDGYEIPDRDYLVFPFYPSEGIYVTSQFHLRSNPLETNTGPNLPEEKFHRGIDIVGTKQNLIRATVSGIVVEHFPPPNGYWRGDGVHGGKIVLRDVNGYLHVYSHLSQTYVSSLPGRNWVEAGQEIARMGRTGLTTGAHLHYEIKRIVDGEETWYDPMYYFDIRLSDTGEVMFPVGEEERDALLIRQ